jgi:hypothetical protein
MGKLQGSTRGGDVEFGNSLTAASSHERSSVLAKLLFTEFSTTGLSTEAASSYPAIAA